MEGGKCTKFFFALETRKERTETIKELTKIDLFRNEGIEEENKHYLSHRIKARVEEDKRDW